MVWRGIGFTFSDYQNQSAVRSCRGCISLFVYEIVYPKCLACVKIIKLEFLPMNLMGERSRRL